MIQENRNVIVNEIILVITKKATTKRGVMIQENRNVIGNEIMLVITKKATAK